MPYARSDKTKFFKRAHMLDTEVGQAEKADPPEVAKAGFEQAFLDRVGHHIRRPILQPFLVTASSVETPSASAFLSMPVKYSLSGRTSSPKRRSPHDDAFAARFQHNRPFSTAEDYTRDANAVLCSMACRMSVKAMGALWDEKTSSACCVTVI